MKLLCTLFLGTFCLLVLSVPAQAQEASPAFKAEALTATRQLAAFIALDDARQLPVRRLTQLRLTQEAEARQLYANDPDMLQKKLTAIGQDYTQQLGTVLTSTQYQRYLGAASGLLPSAVAAISLPAPVISTAVATVAAPAMPVQAAKPAKATPAKTTVPRTSAAAAAHHHTTLTKAAVRR